MDSLKEALPAPGEMGWALFLPFVRVIGGCAALLTALYLLVGLEPTAPVGDFVFDSAEAVIPLTGRLAAA